MRKLAALAVLALSLLTVACTESEDVGTGDEAASIDDVDGLAFDDEAGSLLERGVPSDGAADTASQIGATGLLVPPPRPRTGDGLLVPPPRPRTSNATGVADCFVKNNKLTTGEPVTSEMSSAELGRRAHDRLEQIARIKGKAPAVRTERVGSTFKNF